jgi:hypothetical protein
VPFRGLTVVDNLPAKLVLADVGGLGQAVIGANIETENDGLADDTASPLAALKFELHIFPRTHRSGVANACHPPKGLQEQHRILCRRYF